MKFLFCFAAFLQSVLFAESTTATLQALILAETSDESQIGLGVEKDIEHVSKALQTISKQIKYPLKLTVLRDSHFSTSSLQKWLVSLPQSTSNITFFYYSGHGVADRPRKEWPAMALSDAVLSGSSVVEYLAKNRHRLDIVLFDCCNTKADLDILHTFKSSASVLPFKKNMPGLKKLFLTSRALIVAAAAKRGEESGLFLAGPYAGSFFTNAFFLALKNCSQKNRVSWKNVFLETDRNALKLSHGEQHLIYKID
jgi:hypothetical protein